MHVVLESTPRFIACREALKDGWKSAKIDCVLMLLKGAIAAATRVLLSMNLHRDNVDAVLKLLPALATPARLAVSSGERGQRCRRASASRVSDTPSARAPR